MEHGAEVYVSESGTDEAVLKRKDILVKKGIKVELAGHSREYCLNCDFAVVSPGVPVNRDIVRELESNNIKVISEIEFANSFCGSKVIAVTGTNGKSTTCELINMILNAAGKDSDAGGNLGKPFSQMIIEKPDREYMIIEISSFQLERIFDFNPFIAAILNLEPDHLDRHRTEKEYYSAKIRLFEMQTTGWRIFRIQDEDKIGKNIIKGGVECLKVGDGLTKASIFEENGQIHLPLKGKEKTVIKCSALKLKGKHNIENAMFSSGISMLCGVDSGVIESVLPKFAGLKHRNEFVAEIKGISYVDDSKATNVAALKASLKAVSGDVILIAGGLWKKDSFGAAREIMRRKVKKCFLIGKDAPGIKKQLKGVCSADDVNTLEHAVKEAFKTAREGDTVLLSPGCASFDMFSGYEERGEKFSKEVMKLKKGGVV
ncbi:MAG: UDP-N-acetylmuramoyl-L-alanine--D-glutamate ligase [bacterium]|nr:UDP-N-acetylmuramoyl-L-alanine--D-glutamate ligase [bacterium]